MVSAGTPPRHRGSVSEEADPRSRPAWRLRLVDVLVVLTLVLNLLDATGTLWAVGTGLALEANPLLVEALETGPVYFVAVKTSLACLGVFLLWRFRAFALAQVGAYLCFVVYWTLIGWFWLWIFY